MNAIKRARLLKGVTQIDLAKELGVSHVTVNKWEKGKMFPDVKRLKQVADVLNVHVEDLLPKE